MKYFKFRHSFFAIICIFILLPMLVILPFSIISTMFFKSFYSDTLQSQYSAKLESICNENEIILQSIAKNVHFLQTDGAFIRAFTGSSDGSDISHSMFQLAKICENYPIIDNIAIVQRSTGKTYSIDGIFENNDFFDTQYVYLLYNSEYWQKYQASYSEKRVLPPTKVQTKSTLKTIIPIIFTRVGDVHSSNLLIVNVSLSNILETLSDNMEQTEAIAGLINRQTLEWFDNEGSLYKINNDFWGKIAPRGTIAFDFNLNGINSLIVTYSPRKSVLPYTYAVAIPASVIAQQVRFLLFSLIFIWLVVFLMIILLTQFSVKTIYAPVKSLIETISPKPEKLKDKANEFEIIQNFIQHAKDTMVTYLPMVQERLLVEYLNNSSPNIEETKKQFIDNGLEFTKDFFCSIVLRLRPTDGYYRQYTNAQHENIMRNILDVVCAIFPETYGAYSVPIKSNMLYVLLNVDKTVRSVDVESILKEFSGYLEPDKEIIHLKIAVGGIYKDLDGLKRSHDEATRDIEGIAVSPDAKEEQVNLPYKRKKHIFDDQQAAELTNYLFTGQVQIAREYINLIIKKNMDNYVSNVAIPNLYIRIANTVLNVMRLRQITYDGDKIDDIDLVSRFFALPLEELRGTIEKMLDSIENNTSVAKLDVSEIVAYIQEHYTENLHLDSLADKYKTSVPYLSRILKESLGITFMEFIGNLRINKAKQLLKSTKNSINDISELSGFGSRSAFTRSFTEHTGMTPTQYRKIAKG